MLLTTGNRTEYEGNKVLVPDYDGLKKKKQAQVELYLDGKEKDGTLSPHWLWGAAIFLPPAFLVHPAFLIGCLVWFFATCIIGIASDGRKIAPKKPDARIIKLDGDNRWEALQRAFPKDRVQWQRFRVELGESSDLSKQLTKLTTKYLDDMEALSALVDEARQRNSDQLRALSERLDVAAKSFATDAIRILDEHDRQKLEQKAIEEAKTLEIESGKERDFNFRVQMALDDTSNYIVEKAPWT